MRSESDQLQFLASTPLFHDVPRKSLKSVLSLAREVDHDAGSVIMREGGTSSSLHVIISGEVTVTSGDREVASLGPTDYFGEIGVLARGSRTATITAKTPLRALTIDATAFRRLVAKDPHLSRGLPEAVATRLSELGGSGD